MPRTWIAAAALAAATLGSAPAKAQLAIDASSPAPIAAAGPTLAGESTAPRLALPAASAPFAVSPAPARRPFGLPQTLMIVGGATLLTGAIIGDDAGTVLMVGGAVVGIYGLYLFLRQPSMAGTGEKPGLGVGYRVSTGS